MKNEIVCKLTGYVVVGLTAMCLWGDDDAVITMEPVEFDHEPSEEEIREAVNDNGFGCQFYYGAIVRVDALYENGARVCGEDVQFINFRPQTVSDSRVLDMLDFGHDSSPVSVWDLDGEILDKWVHRAA